MAAVNAPFNGLLFGTELLLVPLAIAMYVVFAQDTVRRLIALQLVGVVVSAMLALLSIVFATEVFADLAITLALLGIGGGMAYAHFLERWI
jgi:multisubunit Na+/H+ antiporter MnhF subunit